MTKIDQQTSSYSGWREHKSLFELVSFDRLTHNGQKPIIDALFASFHGKVLAGTKHITYWYPIYQLLVYGTTENRIKLTDYLNSLNDTRKQTRYEDVLNMVNENLGKPNILSANQSIVNASIKQISIPQCPTCHSSNIKKITSSKRLLSISILGLASGNIGKTMQCINCGYKW